MVNIITDPLVLSDYPNLLMERTKKRYALPHRNLLLLLLFVACFLPRALLVPKCTSLCPDATLYIKYAQLMEQGYWDPHHVPTQFISYPAVLATLHRLGFDWESGARWWGVLCASLTVLPLFGWIRRQFDDRVAFAGCFLYAVHQGFVEWSPTIIRDQTFWFMFAMSLYLLWRAIVETRPLMLIIAGTVAAVSATIRTEGILLIIPYVIWTFYRWLALKEGRIRLVVASVSGLLICPMILLLIGSALVHQYFNAQPAQISQLFPLKKWQKSIGAVFEHPANDAVPESQATKLDTSSTDRISPNSSTPPIGLNTIPRMSTCKMLWEYVRALEIGITAIYGLLMFLGLWGWRHVWTRSDNQPLFYISLIIMLGIWLDFYYGQRTSKRYPLPIVMMSLPFAGMALLQASQWLRDKTHRSGLNIRWQILALFTPAIFVVSVNYHEVSYRHYTIWESYAKIGHWMRSELGEPPHIAGHEALAKIAGHYSKGQYITIPDKYGPAAIAKIALDRRLDFLLLSKREMRTYDPTGLMAEFKRLGFEEVESYRLPPGSDRILVIERVRPASEKAHYFHSSGSQNH